MRAFDDVQMLVKTPDPRIGLAIGSYVIQSKLADGGMGAVYVAVHPSLGTKRVVKFLLAEYSGNEVIRRRFEREAQATARLKHERVIKIEDFGVLPDGQLYLTMPFLEGVPLDVHIRRQRQHTQHHTLHIVVQICQALEHLHQAGIVHRDLKPANIFISRGTDNPYEVTLIDLGIARDLADTAGALKTQTGLTMGTPGYMAVEQYGNAGHASPAADLYALAIITWEMLTGQMPWGVNDPGILYFLQKTERPQPPPGHSVPDDVLALLLQTLSVHPEDRPGSARAFAIAFASLTPAVPPFIPSGAEILQKVANEFRTGAAPDLETVRNVSHADAVSPPVWPVPSTQVPVRVAAAAFSSPSPRTPVMTPTVSERPAASMTAVVARPTTLGAASGVLSPPGRRPLGRAKVVGIGALGCLLAAGVSFGLVHSHADSAPTEPTAQDRTSVPAREPAPAPIATVLLPPAVVATSPQDAGIAVSPVDATVTVKVDAGGGVTTPFVPAVTSPARATKPPARVQPARPAHGAGKAGSGAAFDPDAVEE